MKKGKVIWLTGLSGSGKTTIANEFKKLNGGIILNGDIVRKLFSNVGFSKKDRDKHVLNVGKFAIIIAYQGIDVICPLISPYRNIRDDIKKLSLENDVNFIEVFVDCPIEICIKRDPKGLYKKALNGEIKDFTGITQAYEEPIEDFLSINTNELNIEDSVEQLYNEVIKND